MIFDLTFKETGWKKNLAIYALIYSSPQEIGTDYNQALQNMKMKSYSEAVRSAGHIKDVIDNYGDLDLVYSQGVLIEKRCSNDRDIWKMIKILGAYGITDVSKYQHRFEALKGIGPRYADILNKVRNLANTRHLN